MHIGGKIKDLRKQRGLSQKELASSIGISASFLSDIGKERSNPSFDKLQRLCVVLNVQPGYFLSHENTYSEYNSLYTEIMKLMKCVETWDEADLLELYNYLKVKTITQRNKKL